MTQQQTSRLTVIHGHYRSQAKKKQKL